VPKGSSTSLEIGEDLMQVSGLKAILAGPAVVLALGAALSGCGGDPDRIYAQGIGFECRNHDNPAARAVCAQHAPGGGEEVVSRYCYRTLGDTNCFDRPDHDRKNQELGSSGY